MISVSLSKNVLICLAFALLANGLSLSSLNTRSDNPGFLKLNFTVPNIDKPIRNSSEFSNITKRELESNLIITSLSYLIPLLFGTNKQPVDVILDTGSADLWVNGPNTTCTAIGGCATNGTYDPSTSHLKDTGESQSLPYGSGVEYIEFYIDEVSFPNGPTIPNVQFGVATSSNLNTGFLGVGSPKDESGPYTEHKPTYDNFPILLKKAGITKKNAFSLYLDLKTGESGAIIFGGIDHDKYNGNLVPLPIVDPARFSVNISTIDNGNGTSWPFEDSVVLDSGSSTLILPYAIALGIHNSVNRDSRGSPLCDQGNNEFNFNFGPVSIKVPYDEFVVRVNSTACADLFILPSELFNVNILGDPFLKYAYTVFDTDDRTISLAQSRFTSDSLITPID